MIGTMIGKKIAHYKIVEKLGEGGMGEVYLADDTKLKRRVALKFLPSQLASNEKFKARFRLEAQAAAALNHPNVITIHEVGEHDGVPFIAMEHVEGQSLKDLISKKRPSADEIIGIAVQICQGLLRAHQRWIIHRDLKPQNILIDKDNRVRILDFGLAKVAKDAMLTKVGTLVGTVDYMSPEQAKGEEVDHRTDIWSLGVVLYEALTGRTPFKGEHDQAVIHSILTEDPEYPDSFRADVPGYLQEVVRKALEKDRTRRYQNVGELLRDLKAPLSSSATPPEEKSIVVLPFDDISPGKDNEYFSDGLTEEIITDLSQIHSLKVISRNASMMLKGTRKSTGMIGRELNVRYVLEGSVRKAGEDLRITAQLIDAADDAHVWAEKYDGTLNDIFDIQEKVSRSIVDALRLKLSPEERKKVAERPIDNVHALECYLRAKREIWLTTEEALKRALKYLQNGLQLMGENAALYAGMGYVYWQYVNLGIKQEDYVKKAAECAQKAFQLDPESPQGHLVLGLICQAIRGDQQQAVRHFKRVLASNPNDYDTLVWLSIGYAVVGKASAAVPLAERALAIDPLNPISQRMPGLLHFYQGRFDLAVEPLAKAYQMDPENPAHFWLALVLAYNKRVREASLVIDHCVRVAPRHFYTLLGLFLKKGLERDKENVSQLLTQGLMKTAQRDPQYSCFMATFYAMLGDKKWALHWLENAVERGFINYPLLSRHDPFLESIRAEKRFKQLMENVKVKWESFEV